MAWRRHDIYNQWRMGVIYGGMTKPGFSAAVSVGLSDARACTSPGGDHSNQLQLGLLRRRLPVSALGAWASVRNENAYRFSFSLTNVGTFGTIKRLQRLY